MAVPTVRLDALVREHGRGIAASLWLGGADGPGWFEREAGILRTSSVDFERLFVRVHVNCSTHVALVSVVRPTAIRGKSSAKNRGRCGKSPSFLKYTGLFRIVKSRT